MLSYGAVDRHLGGLAAVLGRRDEAIRHLRAAIERDAEMGCAVWRLHGQHRLYCLAPDDALATEAAATARALGLGLPPGSSNSFKQAARSVGRDGRTGQADAGSR